MFPSCQKALVISANPTLQTQVVFQHKFVKLPEGLRGTAGKCWHLAASMCAEEERGTKKKTNYLCGVVFGLSSWS